MAQKKKNTAHLSNIFESYNHLPLMNEKTTKFDTYIIKSILANNNWNITTINLFKSIKSLYFNTAVYQKIEGLIKAGRITELVELSDSESNSTEYLDVIHFTDQNNDPYIVTTYDNNDLSQDPQVIDIFKL